jgi:hypothetical protein
MTFGLAEVTCDKFTAGPAALSMVVQPPHYASSTLQNTGRALWEVSKALARFDLLNAALLLVSQKNSGEVITEKILDELTT